MTPAGDAEAAALVEGDCRGVGCRRAGSDGNVHADLLREINRFVRERFPKRAAQ
jgi:hypothetical protein